MVFFKKKIGSYTLQKMMHNSRQKNSSKKINLSTEKKSKNNFVKLCAYFDKKFRSKKF
jgi:hypothetical protein